MTEHQICSCGKTMLLCEGSSSVYMCPVGHLYDSVDGYRLGCDCGFCQSRPPLMRMWATLQETGYSSKVAGPPVAYMPSCTHKESYGDKI
jgi:hypothetical protein